MSKPQETDKTETTDKAEKTDKKHKNDVLYRLSETLAARRNADPESSYTAQLLASGPDSILKKIGEECAELIMAGKEGKRLKIVWETTDVVYHLMVLLAYYGLGAEDVLQELRRREGISGIDEKKSRGGKDDKKAKDGHK
jgi:phosphoribosyl-ATP pyrophosphohydrolase